MAAAIAPTTSRSPRGFVHRQPAVHLIPFLESYEWIHLYPINPITLQKYQEAFVTKLTQDDSKDAATQPNCC